MATFSTSLNPNGFIGGGQVGYNYQFYNSWVVGLEVDIQGIAGAHSSSSFNGTLENPIFPANPLTQTATVSKSLDYLGTVRGRFGFLLTPTLLIFGDGGLAYGGVNSSTSIAQTLNNVAADVLQNNPYLSAGTFSNTRVGWTAGGGAEWMFLPKWSVKVEYLYYDLGNVTYNLSPLVAANTAGGIVSTAFPRTTTRFDGHVVRAGLNYHF